MSSANSSYTLVSFLYTLGAPAQYLLTTTVSPLASGSISASPSSTDGYYNTGTSVQLHRESRCRLHIPVLDRRMDGSTNPQSVTMSAAQSVTANFSAAGRRLLRFSRAMPEQSFLAPRLRTAGWA